VTDHQANRSRQSFRSNIYISPRAAAIALSSTDQAVRGGPRRYPLPAESYGTRRGCSRRGHGDAAVPVDDPPPVSSVPGRPRGRRRGFAPSFGVLGWFGPVDGQAFFQLRQRLPRTAGLTSHAWRRREHRLRRYQAHPRGRSPRAERVSDPTVCRTTWPANHAVDPVGQGLLSGSASDMSNGGSYWCDQRCVARSAGTQS
jgi:hypothetical protein